MPEPDVQGGKQEVNIVTTRFGLIVASESELIRIPEGLVGFRSFTQYVHLPDPIVAGLSWLQSVTAPELAFGLVAPPPGGQRLSGGTPSGRPGGAGAGRGAFGARLRDPQPRRRGGPDGQPPGALGVQPRPPARPADGVDLESLCGPVPPRWSGPSAHPAARSVGAPRDGVTRRSVMDTFDVPSRAPSW